MTTARRNSSPTVPIGVFVRWLHRRRVTGRWAEHDPWGDDWPWGDNTDPWTGVAGWIARQTGFLDTTVNKYMLAVGKQQPAQVDQYVSRELFKWWEEGNGNRLIQKFWEAYPDVAASMKGLPRPATQIRRRKRAKRPKRTTLTKRERQVQLRLDSGQPQVKIAEALDITDGRVSQIKKAIEEKEKASASRSVPMGKTLLLRDDHSPENTTPKRTRRQRKRSPDEV